MYLGDAHFWRVMATSPFMLWFIGLVIFFCQRSGLYGKQAGSQVRYAKPVQQRVFPLIILASLLWIVVIVGPAHYVELGLIVAGLVPLFAYMAGPSEITIDIDTKTYIAKFGWPIVPKAWAGPLSDISRLGVGCTSGNCILTIRWKQKRAGIIIGAFGSRAKAEAAAAQVAKLLEIDVTIGSAGRTGQIYRNQ